MTTHDNIMIFIAIVVAFIGGMFNGLLIGGFFDKDK